VSSSRNAERVLEVVGLADRFETVVDGEVAAALELEGKPAPDTFLEGARRLGVDPARTVVVEDAAAGVEAGRLGGFGLVIGISREGDEQRLHQSGADVVVTDLTELLDD
jgi:HAD superfamily hydrolase (TIGR01509 family)